MTGVNLHDSFVFVDGGDMMSQPEKKVHQGGIEEWMLNGKRHREDGPAVTSPNGYQEWMLNGKRHREDGPAITYPNGTQEWMLNGKLHREDGPAMTYPNGTQEWYLNGKQIRSENYESSRFKARWKKL